MAGGLTFGSEKDKLRMVTDNGVGVADERVMLRSNEATQEILAELIPVNGMMTADIAVDANGYFLLPVEMNTVIEAEVMGDAQVNGQTDVRSGWYDIVNPFTYVDPSVAHDNPLIDNFLVPDPDDPAILRRAYTYPGLSEAIVRVTGPKAYVAITQDADYLIVQNVPALKLMIQSIERRENNDVDGALKYKQWALELLTAEVKRHQLDPRNSMRRKAAYEADLTTFKRGTFGWTRARLALEVPGAQTLGNLALNRLLERGEQRLMERGIFKGCVEEFEATVTGGDVIFPARVEAVLASDLCGTPLDLRSIFFTYLEHGPGGWDCSCGGRLQDRGEITLSTGVRRRRYLINGSYGRSSLRAVCKVRWLPKKPDESMTILNLDAMRLSCDSIIQEQNEKWTEANQSMARAIDILQMELKEYLGGIQQSIPTVPSGCGLGDLGGVL